MSKTKTFIDQHLDKDAKGPVINAVDELLKDIESADQAKRFSFELFGHVVYFRYPESAGEMRRYQNSMAEFLFRMLDKDFVAGMTPPYRDALAIRKMDNDDLLVAHCFHFWSDSETKISEPAALTMVAKDPGLFYDLYLRIDYALKQGGTIIPFGSVLEKKETSKTTDTGGSNSKAPVSTESENTPTT